MTNAFGRLQYLSSDKMRTRPTLGRLFYNVFGYTNVGNYARSRVFLRLLQDLPYRKFKRVLDLGCGYGEYSILLTDLVPSVQVTALDIDSERCSTLANTVFAADLQRQIEVLCRPIENTAAMPTYDFIFAIDVFEHINPAAMPFAAALERLKPGGYFLVKIPNEKQRTILPENWFEEHQAWLEEEHIGQVYDLPGLKKRFVQEGFAVVHSAATDGWLSRFAWELAWLGKKGGMMTQLLTLPLAKLFIVLDPLFHRSTWGNAIHVVGQKPL